MLQENQPLGCLNLVYFLYMGFLFGGIGLVVGLLFGVVLGRRSAGAPRFTAQEEDARLDAAHEAVNERIKQRLEKILAAARAEGRITNDGVEELFCISDRTASTYLRRLTDDGRLRREGSGRYTSYTPI